MARGRFVVLFSHLNVISHFTSKATEQGASGVMIKV